MSTQQARTPAGAPTGGEFAATPRTEPLVRLDAAGSVSAAELDADAAITRSIMEAVALTARIEDARTVLSGARRQTTLHSALLSQELDALAWSATATRAEEDLDDLLALREGTAPGLAALQYAVESHLHEARAAQSNPSLANYLAAETHLEFVAVATERLTAAVATSELTPVTGGEDDQWAHLPVVAREILDENTGEPGAYRLVFVTLGAGARVTLPSVDCQDPRTGHLDRGAIMAAIVDLAQDPGAGAPARSILDLLDQQRTESAA